MEINIITKYSFKGKEYKSLKDIKEEIHNTIGLEVLDKIVRVCPPQKHKDLFALLDVLCLPEVRKILIECYTITIEKPSKEWNEEPEIINILDI